jgi:para-aminobenzoate synthetase / 4-amino-4-deoxychorismate lyase
MIRTILDFPAPPVPGPAAVPDSPGAPEAPEAPGAPAAPAALRQRFAEPRRVLEAGAHAEVLPVLRAAAAAAAAGHWVVGYVAYEAAPAFDAALRTRPHAGPAPLAWFGVFDAPDSGHAPAGGDVASLPWATATRPADYDRAIREIHHRIAAGDVYQVNHTLRFRAGCRLQPLPLYDALVAARHGLHHALISTPRWTIVSASPELFFDVSADGVITTRPMKGTARRGRWSGEDDDAARALCESAKDRAENLMIVDLLRNDLGRVAEFGSVMVPSMFDVETYPTVHQLTSTVTARLRGGTDVSDIFAAMFPCGSVTGAPKVTAMRTIADLEDEPRGPYCGAVGVIRPDGSATFNVAIRTVLIDHVTDTAVYGAGGGITWDSRADAEFDEVVAKARLLTEQLPAFELIETLRLDAGTFSRLDRHLHRLADSARYWRFDPRTAHNAAIALEDVRLALPRNSWRVRLTASRDGGITTTHSRIAPPDATPDPFGTTVAARIAVADSPVSSDDRLLFHKTTARATYDARRAEAPEAFDVLLFNEAGMATEFTIGNLVIDLDGVLITPPRSHGLLAGTMRAEFLDSGVITEVPVPLADVHRAARIFHINSVRGVTRVSLDAPLFA